MSFSENPFMHFTVGWGTDGYLHGECSSCGNENIGKYVPLTPLQNVMDDMSDHVRNSHKRTPESFVGWH